MTIDEAIQQLKSAKKRAHKTYCLLGWDSSQFDRPDNDAWASACDLCDDNMDWSYTHDQLNDLMAGAQ